MSEDDRVMWLALIAILVFTVTGIVMFALGLV